MRIFLETSSFGVLKTVLIRVEEGWMRELGGRVGVIESHSYSTPPYCLHHTPTHFASKAELTLSFPGSFS